MSSPTEPDWEEWAERATLRLAECESEIRRLSEKSDAARRAKLLRRSEIYSSLAATFLDRTSAPPTSAAGPEEVRAAAREVESLKERIVRSATALVRDRKRLNELRALHSGRIGIDFSIPAPPGNATGSARSAHELLRSLGL
jgi:hypothetical protein